MFVVYILFCADNSYYVGCTDNIEKRLQEHRSQKFKGYTSTRLPVKLVWSYKISTRDLALSLEKKIKKWSRVKKEALISGIFNLF